jgi:hypothetical protein
MRGDRAGVSLAGLQAETVFDISVGAGEFGEGAVIT